MISQVEVEQEIQRISRACEHVTHQMAAYSEAAARAEVAYKMEHAKALLASTEKTAGARDAAADLATEKQLLARRLAEAKRDGAQEMARTHRAQLSALQTIAANMRALVTG